MGVPGFFAWLLKNFRKKILCDSLPKSCDYLYIDANCLFHPECNKIKEYFPNDDINELEEKMFQRIINYLIYLENFVNPSNIMSTNVDGVAPLAKMLQQRKRRFKAIIDNNARNLIKKKYGKETNNKWNNTVITPGTVFMENLHKKLLNHFKLRKSKLNMD